ncbi:hypothetical protein AABB24_035085 [Solanum stoloniferum]|uniref:Snurportin-1 n=1 Tax=Solanum stoloniferum TaxID=62892 RepID=A0ABD2RIK7_9SOLN
MAFQLCILGHSESSTLVEIRYVFARPAGKRCFVVSSNGTTISRLRNGVLLHRFPSALPNGARTNNSKAAQSYCILDCIFHESDETYYVIDGVCWAGISLYECTAEFRFFWLNSKLAETGACDVPSTYHKYKFSALPVYNCDKEGLQTAYAGQVPYVKDGLLFYNNYAAYGWHLGVACEQLGPFSEFTCRFILPFSLSALFILMATVTLLPIMELEYNTHMIGKAIDHALDHGTLDGVCCPSVKLSSYVVVSQASSIIKTLSFCTSWPWEAPGDFFLLSFDHNLSLSIPLRHAQYQTGNTPLSLVWKDEHCSQYVIDTDNKGLVQSQQQVVLELLDDGRLATSDDPPVIFGCLLGEFMQKIFTMEILLNLL